MRRRFPPPWTAAELEESFATKDANGQILAYVYFEPDPNNDSRRTVMNRPSPDLKQLKEVGLTHFLRPWVHF
jgi:hypothetical protein